MSEMKKLTNEDLETIQGGAIGRMVGGVRETGATYHSDFSVNVIQAFNSEKAVPLYGANMRELVMKAFGLTGDYSAMELTKYVSYKANHQNKTISYTINIPYSAGKDKDNVEQKMKALLEKSSNL